MRRHSLAAERLPLAAIFFALTLHAHADTAFIGHVTRITSQSDFEVDGTHVSVWRKYPFHDQERIIQFSTETKTYEKYTARIEGEVTSHR